MRLVIPLTMIAAGVLISSALDALAMHGSDEILLIYNGNSSVSKTIAKKYARERNVKNILVIRCRDSALSSDNETIRLEDYSREIAKPVRDYLEHHRQINFIVLTKGIPIRIDGGATGSRDENSTGNLHPSVDSYLAAIDYPEMSSAKKIHIAGSGATGYAWLNRYWKADVPFSHDKFGGYLVTRLDGYTEVDAMSLVDRALKAESEAMLHGKVLLDVQPDFGIDRATKQPFTVSDNISDESKWETWNSDLVESGDLLRQLNVPFELDMERAFVGNRKDLLGYFSWGSNDSHYSKEAYESLTFAPGSIGDTAVSTSARTFLPTTGGQSLIADLIAHGITGVKGYVDEPLLQAIASPSVLLDRYYSGFTMAESFYAASRFMGWEDIVIGDPLCCSSAKATARRHRALTRSHPMGLSATGNHISTRDSGSPNGIGLD